MVFGKSGLWRGLSFVLERALLLVHTADDNAHRDPEVVLLLLAEKGEPGPGLQVVGLEPQCETWTDFVIEAATGHQRPAGADFRFSNTFRGSLAADTLMSVHKLAKWGPIFILAAGKIVAPKKVLLPRRRIECGSRRTKLTASRKWRRHGCRNLGSSEVLTAIDHKPQPTGRVQAKRSIPTRQPRPVSGVKKTGFGVRTAGKQFEARILDRRCGAGGSSWSWKPDGHGGGGWGRGLIGRGSWGWGLRWGLCPRNS